MKFGWDTLDQDIQAVESALAAERAQFATSLKDCAEGARHSAVKTLTAPKFLLGALGIGFVAGRFLLRGRAKRSHGADSSAENRRAAKRGVMGLLGATAFSLLNRHFGGPLGLARWAISLMPARHNLRGGVGRGNRSRTAPPKNSADLPHAP